MLTFSSNPRVADEQLHAIIYYLTVFGYIDGDFDPSEKQFIRDYIRELVPQRVEAVGMRRDDPQFRNTCGQYEQYFLHQFERVDLWIQGLLQEAVAAGEDQHRWAYEKLKVRCFEIFQSFDERNQNELLETVDELIRADGVLHPAELRFREELVALLRTRIPPAVMAAPEVPPPAVPEAPRPGLTVRPRTRLPVQVARLPLLEALEHHYSSDRKRLMDQAAADYQLILTTLQILTRQKNAGGGKLSEKRSADELLSEEQAFLDDHIYGVPPQPDRRYELTVLGDLHGCYSCLKAALAQSDFIRKVEAFRRDPRNNPDPKLILLGDYIDRGRFSYEGVLRAALQLFTAMPEHVFLLRGNHEYYLEKNGRIFSGVAPAEAYATMVQHWPMEQFHGYRNLFEAMPTALFFGDILFVHAGIPRDQTFNSIWYDLTTLNEAKIRFEMMWSDPSDVDYIPDDLQRSTTRFSFGKIQFRNFMRRIGAKTLIRGHEKVDTGLQENYNFDGLRLFTLFSAGGAQNNDLPAQSAYRGVTPTALTIEWHAEQTTITPWDIDYAAFNHPERNNFFRTAPELPGIA